MARKLQQRAIETRKRILTAARELFAERGYSGATVDEIALRAKANKQRIYAYFGITRFCYLIRLFDKF